MLFVFAFCPSDSRLYVRPMDMKDMIKKWYTNASINSYFMGRRFRLRTIIPSIPPMRQLGIRNVWKNLNRALRKIPISRKIDIAPNASNGSNGKGVSMYSSGIYLLRTDANVFYVTLM